MPQSGSDGLAHTNWKVCDMGFQRGLLILGFEDPEFAGLEVRSKRFSIGELLDVMMFPSRLNAGDDGQRRDVLSSMAQMLDSKIVAWNYEDEEGLPVDKCAKEIEALDQDFLTAILRGITAGSKQVAAPLEKPSEDGGLEAQIPMEPLPDLPPS